MHWARTSAVVGLVLFQLGSLMTTALHDPDFAWAPSYFDGDDGDVLPVLLSEPAPSPADLSRGWRPVVTAVAAVPAWRPLGRSRLAVACTRFRAPPLR